MTQRDVRGASPKISSIYFLCLSTAVTPVNSQLQTLNDQGSEHQKRGTLVHELGPVVLLWPQHCSKRKTQIDQFQGGKTQIEGLALAQGHATARHAKFEQLSIPGRRTMTQPPMGAPIAVPIETTQAERSI